MRTKTVMLNFISDAFPQVIIFILGIFKIKIFIDLLGADALGLYQLYAQIVAYLVLLEGGVGSALLYRLYKPLSGKDSKKVSSLMSASRTIFNVIGILIVLVGIIISYNLDLFITNVDFKYHYMQLVFIIYLIGQAVFYLTIPQRIMFEADQKRYVPNIIFQTSNIIKSIVEIIIVLTGNGLLTIVSSLVVFSILSNIVLNYFYKKEYSKLVKIESKSKDKKDFSMLKDVKHLFVNTLGNLLTNNIDVIIISTVIGLPAVVIYTTYNYFVEGIKTFIDKITGSTMASVGNLMVTDKEKSYEIFKEFNHFVFYIGTVLSLSVLVCINQFISIWYEGKIEVTNALSILFTIILFYQIIRLPLKVYVFGAGKFKLIKNFVIVEIIINLGLSIILVQEMGIAGVLLATIISLIIADFAVKPRVITNKILNQKTKNYYILAFKNIIFASVLGAVIYFLAPTNYSSFLLFLGYSAGFFFVIVGATTIFYKATKQFDFTSRFNILKKR